jgi:cardiolipin synthase A/B
LFDPTLSWLFATGVAVLEVVIIVTFIPWVLLTKKDATAALAWCMVVLFMPFLGAFLFWVFGYNHIQRPLRRRRRQRDKFRSQHPPQTREAERNADEQSVSDPTFDQLSRLARKLNAFPVSHGNKVTLFADTREAFAALLEAIAGAEKHVHLEYYIFRGDRTGSELLQVLAERARKGVEVRLLYDAMGGLRLGRRALRELVEAGGKVTVFLPLNPLRSRIQVNLRNHRKIVVVDGRLGFLGGMNIGDEYLGWDGYFGYWRDEVMLLEGPAVAGLQRVFVEDWDFACQEACNGRSYFPVLPEVGDATVQVVESGPDQQENSIREIFFAAILAARERVWIASPYFVPDGGIRDALRLARYRGVDVRLLTLLKPDQILPMYAAHYYFGEMLEVGVRVFRYGKGMMHAKFLMVDGKWAMVGSANLDNRSLHLNFEVGCMLHGPRLVGELEKQFEHDLGNALELKREEYNKRPFVVRLAENACRLLSPLL